MTQLYFDKLGAHLKGALAPVYIVSSDEPLLLQDACDQIRLATKQQGFLEREIMHAETGFNWGTLLESAHSMSLFADKKLIELRIAKGKPQDKGKSLMSYCQAKPEDTILLIITGGLDKKTTNTKWFKAASSWGCYLPIFPLDRQSLPRWLGDRLRQAKMEASSEVLEYLSDRVEGNLLAAAQEVEKLKLAYPQGHILSLAELEEDVADSARYDRSNLVEAAMLGDVVRTGRLIQGLQAEGFDALALVGTLGWEVRCLIEVQKQLSLGRSLDQSLQAGKVWGKRKTLAAKAIKRLKPQQLRAVLKQLSRIDQAVKGVDKADPWSLLQDAAMRLAGVTTAQVFVQGVP